MILALETVRRTCSACVLGDDGCVVALRIGGEAEHDAAALLDALIRAHGRPRALAVAVGPGSFTGLRVAVVAVRTCAWVDELPVHAVDALTARAVAAGSGLWWVLQPLKRDTTHHALVRVGGDGAPEILDATTASLDAAPPVLRPEHAAAVAIGPALAEKPGLAERWGAQRLGEATGLDALGVARAARWTPAVAWRDLRPAYHQEAAPVLQRGAGR